MCSSLVIINIVVKQLHLQHSTRACFSQSASHLLALLADALCASIIRLFGEYLCESTLLFSALLNLYSSIPIPPARRWSGNTYDGVLQIFVAYPLLPLNLTLRASCLLYLLREILLLLSRDWRWSALSAAQSALWHNTCGITDEINLEFSAAARHMHLFTAERGLDSCKHV